MIEPSSIYTGSMTQFKRISLKHILRSACFYANQREKKKDDNEF